MWQTGRNGVTSGTLAVLAGESVQSLKRFQFATGSRGGVVVDIIHASWKQLGRSATLATGCTCSFKRQALLGSCLLIQANASMDEAVTASAAGPASTPPESNNTNQSAFKSMQDRKRCAATLATGNTCSFKRQVLLYIKYTTHIYIYIYIPTRFAYSA